MVLGDAFSILETFVWILSRISRSITWSLFTLRASYLGHVRLGSIRNKNNWNNASKRLFGSYSYSGIPGFRSGYSAPRSRIAGIYSGIHSYYGIFPNERALGQMTNLNMIFHVVMSVYRLVKI